MALQKFPDVTLVPTLVRSLPTTLYYWFFLGNITPGTATTLSDLVGGSWTAIGSVAGADFTLTSLAAHIARVTAADIGYTNSSGSTVSPYGYFVTTGNAGSAPSGDLVLALRYDSAPLSIPNGDSLAVTPTIALKAP